MEALHLIKLKPKQNIGKWKAESPQNKPTLHGCHGVFSPRSRSIVRRLLDNSRDWIEGRPGRSLTADYADCANFQFSTFPISAFPLSVRRNALLSFEVNKALGHIY